MNKIHLGKRRFFITVVEAGRRKIGRKSSRPYTLTKTLQIRSRMKRGKTQDLPGQCTTVMIGCGHGRLTHCRHILTLFYLHVICNVPLEPRFTPVSEQVNSTLSTRKR